MASHLDGYPCLASSKQKRYHYFKINGCIDFACALILQNLEEQSRIILKLLWQKPCTISRCWQPCKMSSLISRETPRRKLDCVSSSSLSAHMAFRCVAVALDKGRGGIVQPPLMWSLRGPRLCSTGMSLPRVTVAVACEPALSLPLALLAGLLLPQRWGWYCVLLARWGGGCSLLAVRAVLVSCPGPSERASLIDLLEVWILLQEWSLVCIQPLEDNMPFTHCQAAFSKACLGDWMPHWRSTSTGPQLGLFLWPLDFTVRLLGQDSNIRLL